MWLEEDCSFPHLPVPFTSPWIPSLTTSVQGKPAVAMSELLQADYMSWKSCSSSETWSSAWSKHRLPALKKHSCSWTRSRGSGSPVIHQINQAPRSNSSKRVQSKHCDSEKDKWHKKPKESLKKRYGNISLDHLLPQLNSSILYKHKVMRSWKIEKLCRKDGMCSYSKSRL